MANTLELSNYANFSFVLNPPSFVGYQATTQSFGANAWNSLTLDAETYDNYNGHSNSVNNSRYTCQVPGWYTCQGVYTPSGNASGFRAVRLTKNGNPVLGSAKYSEQPDGSGMGIITPTKDIQLAVGDYVEVQGWQNSGGSLPTDIDVDMRCGLWVKFSHF